ncbi:MAG: hypothetical protein AAGK97_11340, partial [Bacteroidota bacterium]
ENVPNEEENPTNYIAKSKGALHRVRFEKTYFFNLVSDSGLNVKEFYHQEISRTKQSVLILNRIN